jgi:hypothetical protein
MILITVGFLVSYDYEFLRSSIPLIYDDSDRIVLAIDINFNTWSGNKFSIAPEFFEWIKAFDVEKKIEIYRDDFYKSDLSTMQNDTRERTMLSEYIGRDCWYIQLDSDEMFINFKGFVASLNKNSHFLIQPEKNKVQICLFFVNLFKKVEGGYLYVSKPFEPFTIASNFINYKTARVTFGRKKYLPFFVIHNTWARDEKEIYFKLNNWSHNKDFDIEKYFSFWKNMSKSNYTTFQDVHPVEGKKWQSLEFCPGENLEDLVRFFKNNKKLKISKFFISAKNIAQSLKHSKF